MAFIVFEGIDGSGKSSLMARLEAELRRRSLLFITTREPGGTLLGESIRALILNKSEDFPTPRTELLLYEASRAQHVDKVIRPALDLGHWVLCDRFTASSVAFQGGGRDIAEDEVVWLNTFATGGLCADLTVLLDLSIAESKKRRQVRALLTGESEDRMESEQDEFHQKVRENFLRQSQGASKKEAPGAWLVLDASQSPEVLAEMLFGEMAQRAFWE